MDLIKEIIHKSNGLSAKGTKAHTKPPAPKKNINGHLTKTINLVELITIAKIIPTDAFKNCFKVISPINLNS